MECRHFLLRFAQVCRSRKGFRHRLALDSYRKPIVGPVAPIVGLGTVTTGLAALAESGGNGAPPKITHAGQLPI